MRKRLSALLGVMLLLASVSFAQKRTNRTALEGDVARLDKALIAKDTAALSLLLKGNLQYVHSNGWMETAAELRANLLNGKLSYTSITHHRPPIITMALNSKTGLVREDVTIDVVLDGKPLQLTLAVMQVWIWHQKYGWQLLGRQSAKVEKHG